ncbi:MAG: hypothetical protein ABIR24_05565, partial [Verrucomicrobiota bacterium]
MFTRLFIAAIFLRRCATGSSTVSKKHFQSGESVIPAGEEAARLAFPPKPHQSIEVHSTYRKNLPQTIRDEEGRDFAVDYEPGEIRRTAPSRIPDFRTNVLFGVEDFDHGKFPGFSNNKFFVFVDYAIKRKSIGSSNRRK